MVMSTARNGGFFSGFNMVNFIYLHKNIVLVGVENLPVIARDENNALVGGIPTSLKNTKVS